MNTDLNGWLAVNMMDMHLAEGLGGPAGYWTFRDLSRPGVRGENWNPLRNDAQAMMVLDRMIELEWDCLSLSYSQCAQPKTASWVLSLTKADLPFIEGDGSDTRAEAICQAAKAAIEAERAQRRANCSHCGAWLE